MSIRINNKELEFDVIIYVEEASGNDETADGGQNNPFKTLESAVTASVVDKDKSYAFKLGDGNYMQGRFLRGSGCTKQIAVIGNGAATILNTETPLSIGGNNNEKDETTCPISYYRLIFTDTSTNPANKQCFLHYETNFFNVVFDFQYPQFSYSYFSIKAPLNFFHCIVVPQTSAMLRKNDSLISVYNSYGGFSSGWQTSQNDWDLEGNLIKAPNVDSEYRILDEGWQNAGTGTNPDGSQSNIGVYGGEFAWGDGWETSEQSTLSILMEIDDYIQLSVTQNLSDNDSVNWSSTRETVAEVSTSGLVLAKSIGAATITAKDEDKSFNESLHIKVVEKGESPELKLALYLKIGESRQLYLDDDTENITWSSIGDISVDSNGKVTALNHGLAVVLVEYKGETHQIYVRVQE